MEPRPSGPYFSTDRPNLLAQGDIFADVPLILVPGTFEEQTDLTSGDAIVLTHSCVLEKQPGRRQVTIAPVVPLEAAGVPETALAEFVETDCIHTLMYLPDEGLGQRVALLFRSQPIRRDILEACDRSSRLTEEANRQLMRKLTLLWTGLHYPRAGFEVADGDFPPG
jgi:hypothetical protein